MKKIIISLLVFASVAFIGCSDNTDSSKGSDNNGKENVSIEPSERILITVDDKTVTIGAFEKYYAMQSYDFEKEYGEGVWAIEQDGKTMAEIRQEQTVDYLTRVKLIEGYIKEKGVEIDSAAIEDAYDRYMTSIDKDQGLIDYYAANDLDENFLKTFLTDQYYLKRFGELIFSEVSEDQKTLDVLFEDQYIRYKTRHILLENQDQVAEVLSLLNDEENPADFSDMARLYSSHSTSAVKGGDLGYYLIGTMPKAFEDVALSIEAYTVSDAVETEYGYHIIFVDDRQMLKDMEELGMPEEEMNVYKTEIIKRYAEEETLRVFNELKSNAVIEVDWTLLKEE
jgi:parvulin-like peptidyl-prolyl isomerase